MESLDSLPLQSLERLNRLLAGKQTALDEMWIAPWKFARKSLDPWQTDVLSYLVTRKENLLLCCSSQIGKTEAVSLAAYFAACLGEYVLVASPSDRQSIKFHERLLQQHAALNLVDQKSEPSKHELLLVNGGRVEAVPNSADKIRGIAAVDLLVIDEASRVSDTLYGAVTRMLAVSKGRIALLSTPFGKRGFFYKEWIGQGRTGWRKHRIPWHQCPRLTRDFIEAERRSHDDFFVRQEYLDCPEGDEFLNTEMAYFDADRFRDLIDPELEVVQDW